jgi:hypothetical protein
MRGQRTVSAAARALTVEPLLLFLLGVRASPLPSSRGHRVINASGVHESERCVSRNVGVWTDEE